MESSKIVLFDGVCNLCNSSVQTIIEHDSQNQFRFASLQSEFGQVFLAKNNFNQNDFDSIILIEGSLFYTKSEAVLRIGKNLDKYKLISKMLLFIPRNIRDFGYKIVAKNRYNWFGKKDNCWLPTPELKEKFIN